MYSNFVKGTKTVLSNKNSQIFFIEYQLVMLKLPGLREYLANLFISLFHVLYTYAYHFFQLYFSQIEVFLQCQILYLLSDI